MTKSTHTNFFVTSSSVGLNGNDKITLARSTHSKLPNHNPKSSKSIQEICLSTLKERYNLDIEIPENKLIPMINNRLTYLDWINELVNGKKDQLKLKKEAFFKKIHDQTQTEFKGNEIREDVQNYKYPLDSFQNGINTINSINQIKNSSQEHFDNVIFNENSNGIITKSETNQNINTTHNNTLTTENLNPNNIKNTHASEFRGIDIGTGSIAIYALLGLKVFNWRFICTECNEESYQSATRNVYELNHFSRDEIDIRKVDQNEPLLNKIKKEDGFFDFTICNPPFFESEAHALRSQNPNRVCPGNASELWCPGGEYQFLVRLVDESLKLKDQIGIFSSWIGRKSTLKRIRQYLYSRKITIQYHTQFLEGLQYRWGIAWSFESFEQQKENNASNDSRKINSISINSLQGINEIHSSFVAIHRRMRHIIPESLQEVHMKIQITLNKLVEEMHITQLIVDKLSGEFKFKIPDFESQGSNGVNYKINNNSFNNSINDANQISAKIEFNSLQPKQTLVQFECADFHTNTYQHLYNRICESILFH